MCTRVRVLPVFPKKIKKFKKGGGGGRGQHLGTGGVAGDDPQWRRGLAAEWLEIELRRRSAAPGASW